MAQSLVMSPRLKHRLTVHSLALPGTISFRYCSKGRAGERRARRDGHNRPASNAARSFLVFCRSSGFFAVAGGSRGATVMLRSIAGALQVLSSMRWWGSLCACGARKTPPVPLYPVECATSHPTLRIRAPLPGRMRQDRIWRSSGGHSKAGRATTPPGQKKL